MKTAPAGEMAARLRFLAGRVDALEREVASLRSRGVEKGLLRVDEAAARIGRSPRTVRRWCRKGALDPVLSPGGRMLGVTSASLRELLGVDGGEG
ncbi:MAG: helix-turn-helix domain-containing protein [Proteobacteria bacterium]|nr:helix-turn-helix domain-containing protein [Pseudomonadota bacterium]